jgi:hypothetical protein
MAVVGDLKEFETAFFDENVDLRWFRIDAVFHEFLERIRRPLNDFPSRNFVHDLDGASASLHVRKGHLFIEPLDGSDWLVCTVGPFATSWGRGAVVAFVHGRWWCVCGGDTVRGYARRLMSEVLIVDFEMREKEAGNPHKGRIENEAM